MDTEQLKEVKDKIEKLTDNRPEYVQTDENVFSLRNQFMYCQIDDEEKLFSVWFSITLISVEAAKIALIFYEWCQENKYLYVLSDPVFYKREDGIFVFGESAEKTYQEEFWTNVENKSMSMWENLVEDDKRAEC